MAFRLLRSLTLAVALPMLVAAWVADATVGVAVIAAEPATPQAEIALLLPGEASTLARQCSRPGPPAFEGTWTPGVEQMAALKRHLPGLLVVKSKNGRSLATLSGVHIQVVGLVLSGGKKVLYLNGLHTSVGDSWRSQAVIVCDGGDAFWGAVYDPATGVFSDLAFNGSA